MKKLEEKITRIKAITKRISRKKAVDLDQYDEIHVEALNFYLTWRKLSHKNSKVSLKKPPTTNLWNNTELSARRIINFAFNKKEFEDHEFRNVIEIFEAVTYLKQEVEKAKIGYENEKSETEGIQ